MAQEQKVMLPMDVNTQQFKLIFNYVYPVGSYYETSDSSFNPNDSFVGEWTLEESGRVHIGAGTGYTIGSKGGNKDAIVPYHNHDTSVTQPTFTIPNHTHEMGALWSNGSGSKEVYTMQKNRTLKSRSTTNSGGGKKCIRTTNVAVTVNYAGTSGNVANANMQPYVVVNRWHRNG